MVRLRYAPFAVMLLAQTAFVSPAAMAAGDPDAVRGLVAEHCSKCHAVPSYSREGLPTVAAPPFQTLADDPDTYTEQRLRFFLRQPHWPMTQFRLSPSDIDNLIAYFDSLRAN